MTPTITAPRIAAGLMALGCASLVLRPVVVEDAPPLAALSILFACLLVIGLAWPGGGGVARGDVVAVLLIGVAAFAVARVTGGGHPPHAPVARLLALNSFAAVSEEAFFRRFVFRVLEPSGAALAVTGSATLFALVHVTVYGWWVLPLDLAAGLVLSWQRWATGTWRVPAITHVVANILVVM